MRNVGRNGMKRSIENIRLRSEARKEVKVICRTFARRFENNHLGRGKFGIRSYIT